MRPRNNETVYKLIHSQEMVRFMWRYTLHKQATQIPSSVAFDEPLDFSVLAQAVNVEIARNDCLRLRIFRDGLTIKQFFLPEFRLEKVLLKEFSSKEEQEAFLDADAARELKVFDGETFRVFFFKAADGKSGVYLNVSHMVMDFVAVFIFFRDLMAVYDSLKNGTPLPKPLGRYEDTVKKEQDDPALEERLAREGKILEDWVARNGPPVFQMLNGTKMLDRQRKLTRNPDLRLPHVYMPLNDKTHLLKLHLSAEASRAIDAFLADRQISPEWLLQLGLRIYLAKINQQENDALFWVLCPRRKTVKEKRMGGTLASPMPWRETLPDGISFLQALKQLGETQAFLFRHSDVPYTTIRQSEMKCFHLSLMQSANSVMFSYLPLADDTFSGRSYEFSGYNFGHYVMPLYVIAMRDPAAERYVFSYIHRLWLTTDEEALRFHDGVVRTLLAGIAAPDKTLGEIMEEL
ncbi:MAG: hypothetical protein IK108_10715 [Clostridia bacterium]|nr:hypothetical protein [Clostridia bacterium]